ncbi:hypothetical protein LCGC14_0224830 [marine sediment metagenome]|uniref:Thymidylate synthase (FAD) n=1 Tax=marine sediment metagenome TaxID=412755 RepID=A0A0F9UGX0_9ZZZZ|nr:FAD-dependent thymidylate synthase [bacterium]
MSKLDGLAILKNIELVARTCYKSEGKITEDGESAKRMCKMLVKRGHTAMLEFGGMIHVLIISNRGFTHELVRHRLCSYAQESTRYCDYTKDKHGNEITVIKPLWFSKEQVDFVTKDGFVIEDTSKEYFAWCEAMDAAEISYFRLRKFGVPAQIARGVLPIDIKTEINISTNPTQWRHIFKMRCSKAAHPQIRDIMLGILKDFREKIPIVFDNIEGL